MTDIIKIREKITEEIFDYQQLSAVLSDYSKPRDRISKLLESGELVRIRKGLYAFAEPLRKAKISREILANLLYGPSYITSEYALSYYGMIPERVSVVTSVTTGRTHSFKTPFGVFSYRNYNPAFYTPGITLESTGKYSFLIATPEKALIDKTWQDKAYPGTSISGFASYLADDLRIDTDRLKELDISKLKTIAVAMDSRKINKLLKYLIQLAETNHE